MVSVIQKQQKTRGEGRVFNQQFQHEYYRQLEGNAYSLFVLAMRSPQTKQKYLQRFGYFLDFAGVGTEKETSIKYRLHSPSPIDLILIPLLRTNDPCQIASYVPVRAPSVRSMHELCCSFICGKASNTTL